MYVCVCVGGGAVIGYMYRGGCRKMKGGVDLASLGLMPQAKGESFEHLIFDTIIIVQ